MKEKYIPVLLGLVLGLGLFLAYRWWGFLVLFPWIGGAISIGIHLRMTLPRARKSLGRRVSILLNLPIFLLFIPLANRENLQLEGVVLIVLAGYFSKGFIHYAVAKLFGPLIWGRGFCGWACWTAGVLDWLPVKKQGAIDPRLRHLRYLALALSLALPLYLVLVLQYDVRGSYLNRQELAWMMAGSLIYYLLAIPMAFYFQDRRAFCKIVCPVSLVMKLGSRFAMIKRRPAETPCLECGACDRGCPMDVKVMAHISAGKAIADTECILCNDCKSNCPVGSIR
jgi:polyferredoxin